MTWVDLDFGEECDHDWDLNAEQTECDCGQWLMYGYYSSWPAGAKQQVEVRRYTYDAMANVYKL